jgi:hypothetical protein
MPSPLATRVARASSIEAPFNPIFWERFFDHSILCLASTERSEGGAVPVAVKDREPRRPASCWLLQRHSKAKAVSSMRLRVSSRREQKQSLLPKVGFGPFVVKTSFGASTIANTEAARRYVRSVGPSYRTTYHWKVAERMLEVAWTSAEAEEFAAQAFKIALQTDGWLIE